MYSVVRKSSRSQQAVAAKAASLSSFGINFYNDVPSVELDLDTFEIYALRRLKVLRKLEQLKTFKLTREDLRLKLKQVLDEEELTGTVDETSHFILRLSYCQTEDLRRWFLLHECDLLRIRLQLLPKDQLARLVESYLQIHPIDEDRKQELRPYLVSGNHGMLLSANDFNNTRFFAVPFTQALDLVARRECYLEGGHAYISQHKVEAILVAQFRSQLSRQLSTLQSHVSLDTTLQHDPEGSRVYPLLKNLSHCLIHSDQSSNSADYGGGETLTASTVAKEVSYMPLCMQEMQKGLKVQGKLKYFGRLQYGLFLKSAGLDLDNALLFFQRHFTAVTGEQFQKEYAYGIRYNYGKEGRRKAGTGFSCNHIISGNAPSASGDFYGCPYKHYDADHLSTLLTGLTVQDKKDILALKKEGHYGLACHKQFFAKHPRALDLGDEAVPMDNIGNHPNAWFRASRAYHRATTTSMSPISSTKDTPKGTTFMDSQTTNLATVSPS